MKKILKSIFVLAMTLTVLQLPINLAMAQEDEEDATQVEQNLEARQRPQNPATVGCDGITIPWDCIDHVSSTCRNTSPPQVASCRVVYNRSRRCNEIQWTTLQTCKASEVCRGTGFYNPEAKCVKK